MGRYEDAIDSYREGLRSNPKSVDALSNLGLALCLHGKEEKGISSFHRALAIDPKHVGALSNRARRYYLGGKLEEAVEDFKRVLELQPKNRDSLFGIGRTLKALNRLEEARPYCTKGVKQELLTASPEALGLGPELVAEMKSTVLSGNGQRIEEMLKTHPHLAKVRTEDGRGPLFWAKESNFSQMSKLFVQSGASSSNFDNDCRMPSEV
jgi:tetratricopeptide (TPR) repeat protein